MSNVWVLTQTVGEYEDARETPECVYADESTARAVFDKLAALAKARDEIAKKWGHEQYERHRNTWAGNMPDALIEHLRAEADALGFGLAEGYDLYECPLEAGASADRVACTDHAELEKRVIALLNAPYEADAAAHRRALDAVKVLFMRGT